MHHYPYRCSSQQSKPASAWVKLSPSPTQRRFCRMSPTCNPSLHHACNSTWLSLLKHQPRRRQDVMSRKLSLLRCVFVPPAPLCHRLPVLRLFMSSAPGAQRLLGIKSCQVVFFVSFFFSRDGAKQIAGERKAKLHLLPFPVSKLCSAAPHT